MYKKIAAVFLATSLVSMPAYAHIMNSDSIYTDIAQSNDKEAILYTHAIHLITTDSALYKPNDLLTKKDFALWYYEFKDTKGTDQQLIKTALQDGIISSEDGAITYGEINEALFNGEVTVKEDSAEVTRGEYADFVAKNAESSFKDKESLLQQAEFEKGPTGNVEKVEKVNDEAYELIIDGEKYQLAEHPSVVNDSTDPLVWEGQQVKESLVTKKTTADRVGEGSASEEAKLQFVSIEAAEHSEQTVQKDSSTKQGEAAVEKEDKSSSTSWIVGGAIVVVLVIVGTLLYRKNKK